MQMYREIDMRKTDVASELDRDQEDVMSTISTDGRPPPSELRRSEWRWFGIGAILILIALVVWIVASGASMASIFAGLAYGIALLAAASPVLGAGLLRGGEERTAHAVACSHVRDAHGVEAAECDSTVEANEPVKLVVSAEDMEFHDPVAGAYAPERPQVNSSAIGPGHTGASH